jgi:tRNA G18 (ribose-2'-O)-methylase SpoU
VRRDDPDCYVPPPAAPLPAAASDVIAALGPLVTPARLARLSSVVAARTTRIVPVLEDIADPHNASAILRISSAA